VFSVRISRHSWFVPETKLETYKDVWQRDEPQLDHYAVRTWGCIGLVSLVRFVILNNLLFVKGKRRTNSPIFLGICYSGTKKRPLSGERKSDTSSRSSRVEKNISIGETSASICMFQVIRMKRWSWNSVMIYYYIDWGTWKPVNIWYITPIKYWVDENVPASVC
jgi:hypothetical protein